MESIEIKLLTSKLNRARRLLENANKLEVKNKQTYELNRVKYEQNMNYNKNNNKKEEEDEELKNEYLNKMNELNNYKNLLNRKIIIYENKLKESTTKISDNDINTSEKSTQCTIPDNNLVATKLIEQEIDRNKLIQNNNEKICMINDKIDLIEEKLNRNYLSIIKNIQKNETELLNLRKYIIKNILNSNSQLKKQEVKKVHLIVYKLKRILVLLKEFILKYNFIVYLLVIIITIIFIYLNNNNNKEKQDSNVSNDLSNKSVEFLIKQKILKIKLSISYLMRFLFDYL